MAAVQKVKGVQFNYVNFLWKELARIRDLEVQKEYVAAFHLSMSLMKYLPNDIQAKFTKDIENYRNVMRAIPEKVRSQAIDRFNADIRINDISQQYANKRLELFLSDVCKMLDKKGYMEKTAPIVPEGTGLTLR